MNMKLDDSIKVLAGVSDKRSAFYQKLGIGTVRELLSHYPRGYIDYTNPVPIEEAGTIYRGEYCVIRAAVLKKMAPIFGHTSIFKLLLTDSSGTLTCTFFNCEFVYSRLIVGSEYIFYGKISSGQYPPEIINPIYILPDSPEKLTPKYRLTSGLTHAIVSANVKTAIKALGLMNPDKEPTPVFEYDLPKEIRESYHLMRTDESTAKIHFPATIEENKLAKRSLAFKELLALQLGLAILRSRNRKLTGVQAAECDISDFYKNLPFTPTGAQLRAVRDCISDMKKLVPMNRLLQGDVGSGKTMVAAALAYFSHLNGFQTALMVPTEILANQHYKTLTGFLSSAGIKTVLITGGLTASEKRVRRAEIESGEASVIVGTHALIQKEIKFHELGLVVTDEQHRFGVGQRSELISKGQNPHTLVMSATPIPRTLGLIIYGDLDISLLDEMPKGRLPIKTYGVDSTFRERLYKFIIKEVNAGKQAYIVCPLIDESVGNDGDLNAPRKPKISAVKYYSELQETWFNEIPTGLLHGKMKQSEKDEVMGGFKTGNIKVLVSTTVIEVGVDVPNATVMLIENAEQFGLSQLHQLRGRVGRGEAQSYCILVTDSDSAYTKARIDTMSSTCNGFEIAGKDLELRGPGDFFGQKQHGLPLLKVGDLAADSRILTETQALAKSIIKEDPELNQNIELKQLAAELFKDSNEYGYN
ncbi:MAG: ATP-dependent DNA helicase RecG [Oscillospiraceae bacterium]|nr:ATP-dependent DNA helicase RecG [Oscillospiraceae bacterium]